MSLLSFTVLLYLSFFPSFLSSVKWKSKENFCTEKKEEKNSERPSTLKEEISIFSGFLSEGESDRLDTGVAA